VYEDADSKDSNNENIDKITIRVSYVSIMITMIIKNDGCKVADEVP
jgi:hypothetical protein